MIEALKQELKFLLSLESTLLIQELIVIYTRIINHNTPEVFLIETYKEYCWLVIGGKSYRKFENSNKDENDEITRYMSIMESLKSFI